MHTMPRKIFVISVLLLFASTSYGADEFNKQLNELRVTLPNGLCYVTGGESDCETFFEENLRNSVSIEDYFISTFAECEQIRFHRANGGDGNKLDNRKFIHGLIFLRLPVELKVPLTPLERHMFIRSIVRSSFLSDSEFKYFISSSDGSLSLDEIEETAKDLENSDVYLFRFIPYNSYSAYSCRIDVLEPKKLQASVHSVVAIKYGFVVIFTSKSYEIGHDFQDLKKTNIDIIKKISEIR